MKIKSIPVLAVLAIAIYALPVLAAESGWLIDYEKAKTNAVQEKKDILMDFTGSDWCSYCIQLDKNVFSTAKFKTDAPKHFVLLKLDYPQDSSKQSKEEIAQNGKLQEQYKVSGYPTILLADAKGRPYAQMVGYSGEPVDEYLTKLQESKNTRVKRDEFFTKAAAAQGVEKAKLLDQAVSLLDEELIYSAYQDEINQIIALDKDNSAQLKNKYESKMKVQEVQKKLNEIVNAHQDDPKACLDALNKLYNELKPTGAVAVEVLYVRSFMKYQMQDIKGAQADLDAAIKADPTSPRADDIREIAKRIAENAQEAPPAKQ